MFSCCPFPQVLAVDLGCGLGVRMRKMILTAVAAFAAVMVGSGGTDASAGSRPAIWGGAYFGADIGYGVARLTDGAFSTISMEKAKGFLGGVRAGYNYQSGVLVLGIEGDYDAARLHSSKDFSHLAPGAAIAMDVKGLGSLRGRIGYAFGSNLLIFGSFGYGMSSAKLTGSIKGVTTGNSSARESGIVAGGGFDYKLTDSISIRNDLSHYFFKGTFDGDTSSTRVGTTVYRLGMSYHFN
jgi:outer membrane immunogenic protein